MEEFLVSNLWGQKTIHDTKYSRMDQVKFLQDSIFKFVKGCLPQILPGPFLNI